MDLVGFKAWCERRILRRDFVTFFFGTAMVKVFLEWRRRGATLLGANRNVRAPQGEDV